MSTRFHRFYSVTNDLMITPLCRMMEDVSLGFEMAPRDCLDWTSRSGPVRGYLEKGGSDCVSGRYYLVSVSKSFAVCRMVQCGEGFGTPHCLLMGGIVHALRLGGAFHRLLIDGIDQYTGSELSTFICLMYRAAVSFAKTAGDKASRAGNMQAMMILCCFDFFMYLPSMTACRAYIG